MVAQGTFIPRLLLVGGFIGRRSDTASPYFPERIRLDCELGESSLVPSQVQVFRGLRGPTYLRKRGKSSPFCVFWAPPSSNVSDSIPGVLWAQIHARPLQVQVLAQWDGSDKRIDQICLLSKTLNS